jgi:hypothetical protein
MKIVSNRFAILCAAFGLASFLNLSAQARVYSDASSDLFDNGLANLDILSVEVTNDSSNITITVTTRGYADWTKYLIGIRTAAASSSSTTGNAWSRPASYAEGINFQIAAWVDGATPTAQYIAYTSGAWNWGVATTATMDLTQTAANKVSWTVSLASLGLALGDIVKFDVGTSGGDGNGFIDALSTSNLTTTGWGVASTGGALLTYTTIDPNADGDLDNDNLQDNWEVTYFSNVTAQDGSGDPDSDTLTNEQEEMAGTDPTKADTDGDGWADGSDTAPLVADNVTQNITFKVDMSVQIFKGAFLAGTDMIYVVGDFGLGNIWNTTANLLTDLDSDGVYEGTVAVTSAGLANLGFKYLIGGKTPESVGYENITGNRTLVAAPAGTTPADRTLMSVPFANATATRLVTFQVDMTVAELSGVFDPANDSVEAIGSFTGSGWGAGLPLSDTDQDKIYTLTLYADGADGTETNYKFRIKKGTTTNYTWESDPNRTFNLGVAYSVGGSNTPQVLSVDYFNRVGQSRSITFSVDMSIQQAQNKFDADTGTVEIRGIGSFDASNAKSLARVGGTYVYSGTYTVPGDVGTTFAYKFFSSAVTESGFEIINPSDLYANRVLTFEASGSPMVLETAYFSNQSVVPPSALSYTPSSASGTVGTAITSLNPLVTGTVTSYSVSPALPLGLSLDISSGVISGTPSAVASSADYTVTATNGTGSTTATVTIEVAAAPVGSTFAGAYPGVSMTDVAPNGLTYLANYAFGGNETTPATLPVQDANDPTKLRLVVVFRTDDSTLPLNALGGETTADLAGGWSASGVSVENSTDLSPVPAGTVRKVVSVDRGSDPKKFLRATVTK